MKLFYYKKIENILYNSTYRISLVFCSHNIENTFYKIGINYFDEQFRAENLAEKTTVLPVSLSHET